MKRFLTWWKATGYLPQRMRNAPESPLGSHLTYGCLWGISRDRAFPIDTRLKQGQAGDWQLPASFHCAWFPTGLGSCQKQLRVMLGGRDHWWLNTGKGKWEGPERWEDGHETYGTVTVVLIVTVTWEPSKSSWLGDHWQNPTPQKNQTKTKEQDFLGGPRHQYASVCSLGMWNKVHEVVLLLNSEALMEARSC